MIRYTGRYVKLIVILFFTQITFTQSGLQHWSTENGLSSNWASQILQDGDGYIWIATQYGLNRFDGYEFETFYYEPNNPNSLPANWTRSIATDSTGKFWLGTYWGGVSTFQSKDKTLQHYSLLSKDSSLITAIHQVVCTPKQSIWVATLSGLFVKKDTALHFKSLLQKRISTIQYNQQGQIFVLTDDAIHIFEETSLKEVEKIDFTTNSIRQIFVDHRDVLWIFREDALVELKKQNRVWEEVTILKIDNPPSTFRYLDPPIFEDSQHQLWLGGQNGITIISADRQTFQTIATADFFSNTLPQMDILAFFEDQHHNFWIGTTEGVFMKSPFLKRFESPIKLPDLSAYEEIRATLQTDSLLWIAARDALVVFNLNQPSSKPRKILAETIYTLFNGTNEYVYAGGEFLYQIDVKSFSIEKISEVRKGIILSMAKDQQQRFWFSNLNQLYQFDSERRTFDAFDKNNTPSLNDIPKQDLLIDSKGRLWGASLREGVFLLEKPHQYQQGSIPEFINFAHEPNDLNSLSSNLCTSVAEGKDGNIWVGTDAGLNRIDPSDFSIKRYLRKDGLVDEKIMGLLVDEVGDIWGSTIGHGIFRFNSKTEIFTFFDKRDGLRSNNFLIGAAYKNEEDILFFGADNGIQLLDPEKVKNVQKPTISYGFTHLELAQQNTNDKQGDIDLNSMEQVKLRHDQRSFSIHFTTLNYYQAQKTNYFYQLEGLHDTWQSNDNNRSITLTGLPPNRYELKVKAVNPNLNFEQEYIALELILLPPWWQQDWAYSLYLLLFLFIIYLLYRFQLQQKLKQAEALRLQELDVLKTRFYTNITHELRTPLTIILGMSEQLKNFSKKEIQHKGKLIQRNGQQLLHLINQILDLSKLEAGKLPVQLEHGDLLRYLKYIIESFHSMATTKNIRLHFLPQVEELWMDYDAEKIKQIVSNLLSNALKHTPTNGDIYLQVERQKDQMLLTIRDTGKGIAKEHLPHIFDRFYQTEDSNGGTGVGLALTKELVQVLGGNIKVESHNGTKFEVSIPILKHKNTPPASRQEQVVITNSQLFERKTKTSDLGENIPLILLVEDNQDVLDFLQDSLKYDYRIISAKNGQLGIESALESIPDLIISDVMMPEKDGFELCQTLKTDRRTSHIPIILLTAKADADSRLEGLEQGADAYLSKPFEQQELQVRIRKLLELRQNLQKRYQEADFWKEKAKTKEEDFLLQAKNIIEEHLNDTNFGIPQLCQKLGISRPHLHRKLKALTNQSTSIFIRHIRLQKARILLQTTNLNVSEIAYEVGFSDPAYFSRVYLELFEEKPSETNK